MHEFLVPFREFALIYVCAVSHEKALPCRHDCMLENRLIQLVDVKLRALADINVAKSRRRSGFREQSVEHKRILTMIVESAFCACRVVFRCIQNFAIAEFAVVQNGLSVYGLLVIPIDHSNLFARIYRVIVDILSRVYCRSRKRRADVRVLRLDNIPVHKVNVEKVS